MLSTEVACYTRCTQTSLSIHQQLYLHATLSVVNVRILCKQPEVYSQHSVVAKRCRVTHYGYTAAIPPWLHDITLDVLFFSYGYFEVHTQDVVHYPKVLWSCTHHSVYWVRFSMLPISQSNGCNTVRWYIKTTEVQNEKDKWLWLLVFRQLGVSAS